MAHGEWAWGLRGGKQAAKGQYQIDLFAYMIRTLQALEYGEINQMADKASLFKSVIHEDPFVTCWLPSYS